MLEYALHPSSDNVKQALFQSGNLARRMCYRQISTVHLLQVLWRMDCNASKIMKRFDITDEADLVARCIARHPIGPEPVYGVAWTYDDALHETLRSAKHAADSWGSEKVDTQHLLAGMAIRYQEGSFPCAALEVLHSYGIQPDEFVMYIQRLRPVNA